MYSQLFELEEFIRGYYGGRDLLLVPYAYPLTFTVEGGVTYQKIINISANADFVALGLSHYTYASASTNNPDVTTKDAIGARVLLTDTSSGDQFSDRALHLENFSSDGTGLRNFAIPRLIFGRGAIQVQISTFASINASVLDVCLHGVNVRAWDRARNRPGSGMLARGS